MNNELLLMSKNDIPFQQAQLVIHQPTIKQIAYIGEKALFSGCEFLNFSKDNLEKQDKDRLQDFSNFEILMTMIKNENIAIKQNKIYLQLLLTLIFPGYTVNFLPMSIMLSKDGEQHLIDKDNFEKFRNIVSKMFKLHSAERRKSKYNPGGPQAQALVEKFKEREKKLAKLKREKDIQQVSILARYISILAVGQKKDINELLQYTVYQLFDEFRRFKAKQNFDIYIKAKMAGAQNLQDVDNWMGDLNSSDN